MPHAQVRLHMGTDLSEQKETISALEGARGTLAINWQSGLNLFFSVFPELHFEADVKLAINARIDQLMKRVRRGQARDQEQTKT